jgi:hypothetical protein
MAGVRYGRLVGVRYAGRRRTHAYWVFRCDCGVETVANGAAVRAGRTSSCGCLHREISAARLTTHGHRARKRHDATYRAWQEINTYCAHEGSPRYRDFGGQGVAVGATWREDFEAFLADMGERPRGTMLVRLDAAGDFEPGNCRWTPVRSRTERAQAGRDRAGRDGAGRRDLAVAQVAPAPAPGAGSGRSMVRRTSSDGPSEVVSIAASSAR